MMFKKIDHIAIAVNNIDKSAKLFEKILNVAASKTEIIKSEKVKTKFFHLNDSKIELIEGTDQNSTVAKFVKKKGEGIHHIAIEVHDIQNEIKRLKKQGFNTIKNTVSEGANGKLISFLYPKDTNGVLIELCQKTN